jgi:UDP-N-acetylglucosamine 2-epimerase (non-hydrolysing)
MREVLQANQVGFQQSTILKTLELEPGRFLVVSSHRAENVDIPARLDSLLALLNRLAEQYAIPIVVSTHPRTRQRLETCSHQMHALIRFLKPFGFHDYIRLQQEAFCTLSDSGTISEEASILGFPAVTMRTAMERPEAMDSGHIVLTGLDNETILNSIAFVTSRRDIDGRHRIADEYDVANTSTRVVKLILGTCRLGHLWDGIVAA